MSNQLNPGKTSDFKEWLINNGPEDFDDAEQLYKMEETGPELMPGQKYRIKRSGRATFVDCGPGTEVLTIWSEDAEGTFISMLEEHCRGMTDGMGIPMYRAYLDHMEHD